MTEMQKELYRGRTLACNNCAKTFSADALTPVVMETVRPWSPFTPRPAPTAPPQGQEAVATTAPPARSGGGKAALLSVGIAVAVVGLLLALLVPPLSRAREQSRRTACSQNMRQLGAAMMIYASVNGGRFPDRIDRLLAYVPSATLACPSTEHTAASGQTPQAQAADIARGGHLSYVYVGDAYSTRSPANPAATITLYEPLGDHGDGVHALYADGHVAYLSAAAAAVAIPGLSTATPNPAGPATAPASSGPAPATQAASAQ
jgi:prepilin-type processing-associated H-X9-DG protein